MAYRREYIVDTGFVDGNQKLSLSKLFLMFQECAEEHSERLGTGRDKTTFVGKKWIVTRYLVKFNRMPKFGEKVFMNTYPGKNNPFFFYRHFYLEDEKGNILVVSSCVWAVIDASTNKIVTNPFDHPLPEETRDFELPLPNKIEEDADKLVKTHLVEYSDIDLNGHLNNTKYIELIQNIHDLSFYKNHDYKSFIINYFSEIKEKETVSLYLKETTNGEIVKGAVGDKDSFKALIEYK